MVVTACLEDSLVNQTHKHAHTYRNKDEFQKDAPTFGCMRAVRCGNVSSLSLLWTFSSYRFDTSVAVLIQKTGLKHGATCNEQTVVSVRCVVTEAY
jgi:hypothetical protein